jgi:hypothetical protein
MLSVLIAAVIYSLRVPTTTVVGGVLAMADLNGTNHNGTLADLVSANSSASHAVSNHPANQTLYNHTAANSMHTSLSFNTIDDFPLIVSVATLIAVWAISAAGLLLTIERKYVRTFVSSQTGCAFACSIFLDHEGNDTMRIKIFFCNEQHWRSIRDRVRQWVHNVYALWEQLRPAWFNDNLQARIPDDIMPAQVVVQLNAQAPGGRRKTAVGMGLVRRVTLVAGSDEAASDSTLVANVPSPWGVCAAVTLAVASAATPFKVEAAAPMLGTRKLDDSPNVPLGDAQVPHPAEGGAGGGSV